MLLDRDERPAERFAWPDRQPRKAGGITAARAGDAAGIQPADAVDLLVAWHVGVAVEDDVAIPRRTCGRDVLQVKTDALALEAQDFRPVRHIVIVPQYYLDRRADGGEFAEQLGRADIAEMPDLICAGDPLQENVRKAVVRVGDYGNTHASAGSGCIARAFATGPRRD